jgi:glycosyltransferase involved in cell wall biosynthesis
MSISDGLKLYGYTDDSLIRIPSPLMTDEYQYNPFPHNVAEPFKIGRLSRPDPAKFTSNMWEVYGKIKTNIRVYLMGWSDSVQNVVGLPPVWAECHPAGHMLVQKFMDNIHCMVQVGRVPENRPRSCLEAMACGVPVVAPADSGWKELIIHGETGFLCNSPEEMSHYIAKMADDEEYRLNIARNAADRLSVVASESSIASQWIDLFEAVSNEA